MRPWTERVYNFPPVNYTEVCRRGLKGERDNNINNQQKIDSWVNNVERSCPWILSLPA